MRRIRIVGLCLVAVFAMSALAATAAQAGEYGKCVKQAKPYKGGFNDKNCQETNPGHEGKYEWVPGISPAVPFTGKTKAAELVGAAGTIACKKSEAAGTVEGTKTNHEVVTFEGCEFKGAVTGECHSAGKPVGVIETNKLLTSLIDHGEKGPSGGEPASGEVWASLKPETGTVDAQYECASLVTIKTEGSVAGVLTKGSINVMAKKAELEFNGVLGEEPGKFGEQDLQNQASIGGGPFEPAGQGVEKTTAKLKISDKIEIKT
jgi:hypothetical protein